MANAARIEVTAPREARVSYLLCAYADIAANRPGLAAIVGALPGRHGRARTGAWSEMAETGEIAPLVAELLEFHYDPAYQRSSRKDERRRLGAIAMSGLAGADQDAAARKIVKLLAHG
jgi:tRNA 2-selenouridine synthase